MTPSPVEALTFDLDGTLCRYRRSTHEVLELAFDRADVDPLFTAESYHDSLGQYVDCETMAELRKQCFADLADTNGHDSNDGYRVALAYEELRDHRNVEPLTGMAETLDALSELPMAIITNGAPEMQAQKLEGLGIESRFEFVIHAGYETPAKLDPAPFIEALSRLDVEPSRALHVGNSVDDDVRGADAAGMQSAWLRADSVTPTPRPQYVLDSLTDLAERPWE